MARQQITTVKVEDVEFRVAISDSSDASGTLLCFNGVGFGLEALLPLARALSGFRVVLIDAPGIGGSSDARRPYVLSQLCRKISAVLDALDIAQVHVFGVSWGGTVAQQFARQHPERCQSLILAATSSGVLSIPGNLGLFAQFSDPRKLSDPKFIERISPEIADGDVSSIGPHAADLARAMTGLRPKGYLHQLLALTGWTSWTWLPRVKVPALILSGDRDPLMPVSNGRILASRLANARLETMPFGHLFVFTRPAETARAVEDFLLSISDPRTP